MKSEAGILHALFDVRIPPTVFFNYLCDVAPDGQRFLIDAAQVDAASRPAITVVSNWLASIKK